MIDMFLNLDLLIGCVIIYAKLQTSLPVLATSAWLCHKIVVFAGVSDMIM